MTYVSRSLVEVREESPGRETGGHFGATTIVFQAPVGESQHDRELPIPLAILAVNLPGPLVTTGDRIGVDVSPRKLVGVTQDVVPDGGVAVPVGAAVLDLFKSGTLWVGQLLHLDDGTSEDLGLIKSYDEQAQALTVAIASPREIAAGAEVRVTTSMTPPIWDPGVAQGWWEVSGVESIYEVGESKIGASYVPAGEVVRVRYDNQGPSERTVRLGVEFLY